MNKKAKSKRAGFWKYDGNHDAGRDSLRYDPHEFGIELIAAMAYWADGGDYPSTLTIEDTLKIKVTHHKGDSFGHEVTVAAPSEVWEKGRQALEACDS